MLLCYKDVTLPSSANVVMCTYDTDVPALLLVRKQLYCDHHIWVEVVHYTNGTLRDIEVRPQKLLHEDVDMRNVFSSLGSPYVINVVH